MYESSATVESSGDGVGCLGDRRQCGADRSGDGRIRLVHPLREFERRQRVEVDVDVGEVLGARRTRLLTHVDDLLVALTVVSGGRCLRRRPR